MTPQKKIDRLVRKYATLQNDVSVIQTESSQRIIDIKTAEQAALSPIRKALASIEKELEALVGGELLGNKRSLTVGVAVVGFRKSTRIVITDAAKTIDRIKRAGYEHCLRITESPNKSKLKELGHDVLRTLEISIEENDSFYITIK